MLKLKRSRKNPVLLPNRENKWEAEAVFNGCPIQEGKRIDLLYRAVSFPHSISSIGHAISNDGIHFENRCQLIKPEYEWEKFGCEDPRVTKLDNKYFIFYTALSTYPFTAAGIKIGLAETRDFKTIEKHPVTLFNSKAMALFPERINNKIAGILTINTDMPPAKIAIAFFDKEEQIYSENYWQDWYSSLHSHVIHLMRTPNDQVEVGAPPLRTKHGWLLIYSYIQNYLTPPRTFGIEATLLDLKNPLKVIGRTQGPILVPEEEYELKGNVPNVIFPSGALIYKRKVFIYYGAADTTCCLATCKLKDLIKAIR